MRAWDRQSQATTNNEQAGSLIRSDNGQMSMKNPCRICRVSQSSSEPLRVKMKPGLNPDYRQRWMAVACRSTGLSMAGHRSSVSTWLETKHSVRQKHDMVKLHSYLAVTFWASVCRHLACRAHMMRRTKWTSTQGEGHITRSNDIQEGRKWCWSRRDREKHTYAKLGDWLSWNPSQS